MRFCSKHKCEKNYLHKGREKNTVQQKHEFSFCLIQSRVSIIIFTLIHVVCSSSSPIELVPLEYLMHILDYQKESANTVL